MREKDSIDPLWLELRTLRKEQGLTQQALAEGVGCSRQEISLMENGRFRGSVLKVMRAFRMLKASIRSQVESVSRQQGAPLRILAIDDDQEILNGYSNIFSEGERSGISMMLDLVGERPEAEGPRFQLETTLSGEAGLQMVKRAVKEEAPYQLLLLDMRMPEGWDGLRTAREILKVDPSIRIILISAYSDYTLPKMREDMGEAFVVHHKPYRPSELLQLASFVAHT